MTEPDHFDVIYADPPWQYRNMGTGFGGIAADQYPTMTTDRIAALPIPAADNAVLFLWGTAPLLPDALAVLTAWGFQYKTCAVWDKQLMGVGFWFRGQHEHLLVGVRGYWPPPAPTQRVSSVHSEPRQRHSKKPERIRQLIAHWWPDARRLEMFCRYPAPGWHIWGNQVTSTLADLPVERFDPSIAPGEEMIPIGGPA